MEQNLLEQYARELYQAEISRAPIDPLTERAPGITNEEAYHIQLAGLKLRLAEGQKVVGRKIGLTSKAMQNALGVFEPDYGYIPDKLMLLEGEPLVMEGNLISPKVEAELAFILARDLKGPGVTLADVLRSTAGVMPALEIIDTRIKNWRIKIQDSIADNASLGRIILGGQLTPLKNIDLRYLGQVVERNGEIVSTAAGAAVLGHPANAVVWLVNKLALYGIGLQAGEIIMSGSFTAALPVAPGDHVQAIFDHLGSVGVKFK